MRWFVGGAAVLVLLAVGVVIALKAPWSDGEEARSVDSLLQLLPRNADTFTLLDLEAVRDERQDELEVQVSALFDSERLYQWGIDLDDVQTLLLSDPDESDALTVLQGIFRTDDVADALDAAGFRDDVYRDIEIWVDQRSDTAVALVAENTIVVGEGERVEDSIDAFIGATRSIEQEDDVSEIVDSLGEAPAYSVEENCDYRGCRRWARGVRAESGELVAVFTFAFRDEETASDAERDIDDDLEERGFEPSIDLDGSLVTVTLPVEEEEFRLNRSAVLEFTSGEGEEPPVEPRPAPAAPRAADDHADDITGATRIQVGDRLNGDIEHGGDVDLFSFRAQSGYIYSIRVRHGTNPDTILALLDSDGRFIAEDDDSGGDGEPWLEWAAPSSGIYYVEVRGFDSDATGTYRIEIDESDPEPTPAPQTTAATAPTSVPTASPASTAAPAPKAESAPAATPTPQPTPTPAPPQPTPTPQPTLAPAPDADDHADDISGATRISVGENLDGDIAHGDDIDLFSFRAQSGYHYTIRVRHGTNSDTYLVLYDAEGRYLTEDIDSWGDGEPRLEWTAPSAGIYYVAVMAANVGATGTYRIELYESAPPAGPPPPPVLWSYETGSSVRSSPADAGGVVYVGSEDNRVYALDASNGERIWRYETGDVVFSSPAVSGGVVYVGSYDSHVYALDASTGDLIWSYETGDGVFSSPAVSGGVVYVGSRDNRVYALDASTGDLIWSYETGDVVFSSPAVSGGVVYVGSGDNQVYALDASTGDLIWSYETGDRLYSSPAVSGGVVYAGSGDNRVYALDASTGERIWRYETGDEVFSSPAVSGGVVYVGSNDNRVYALDASTGDLIWSYETGDWVDSSPEVSGGVVYVGSSDNHVYALDASSGDLIWSYETGFGVHSSPAVSGGVVYVGSGDGRLYAISLSLMPVADDHSDDLAGATRISVDEAGDGEIENSDDVDFFAFRTQKDHLYTIRVRHGTNPDTFLVLYDAEGRYLTEDIDSGGDGEPWLEWTAPSSGIYYVAVMAAKVGATGTYRIELYESAPSAGPPPPPVLWSYETGGEVYSSPAVSGGVVYVGSDNRVYALDGSTGERIWRYETGDVVISSPAVSGGVVYVGSWDNRVYALGASTGDLIWSYETGAYVLSSPAVSGGVVYVGSVDGRVYALDASTGDLIWSYETDYRVLSSPTVAGGVVYVGDGRLYALDASTGERIWSYGTGDRLYSSPAVSGGVVYMGSGDNRVYALDASTGERIWRYETGDKVFSSPAVSRGVVYVGSEDNRVYALDASTGDLIWSYETGDGVFSSPAVSGGVVYVGSLDHRVYALDRSTGDLIWSYETGDEVWSSPEVSGDVVYVGSYDNRVYALDASPNTATFLTEAQKDPADLFEIDVQVQPSSPSVGGEVTITAVATGKGGLPQYSLRGEFEPILELKSEVAVDFSVFGKAASWKLLAKETGTVEIVVNVTYETSAVTQDGVIFFRWTLDSSEPITITVGPR